MCNVLSSKAYRKFSKLGCIGHPKHLVFDRTAIISCHYLITFNTLREHVEVFVVELHACL